MLHDRLPICLLRASRQAHLTLEKTIETVCHIQRAADILFDDEKSHAAGLQRWQELIQLINDDRREAEADLITEEKSRVCEQCAPQRHHLLLTAREAAGEKIPALDERGKPAINLIERRGAAPPDAQPDP